MSFSLKCFNSLWKKMAKVPNIKMNNGLFMPGFGLGTFQVRLLTKISFGFWCFLLELKLNLVDFVAGEI